jgi:hypothetical protein
MDKTISGSNTVRENWSLAAKDGVVTKDEVKAIVEAAKAWGGISSSEISQADDLVDEIAEKTVSAHLDFSALLKPALAVSRGLDDESSLFTRYATGPAGNILGQVARAIGRF